jgi:hypothetical protein
MPFVRLWKAYVPVPVRVRKPVLEKPVMLSSAVPLAVEEFVPPLATGTTPVRPVAGTFAHPGEELAPLEVMTWPLVEPAGLISPTGTFVAANATEAKSARSAPKIFFIA